MEKNIKAMIITLLLVLAIIFGGCQKDAAGSSDDSNSGEGSSVISGEIEYASMWNEGEPQADFFIEMAEAFEQKTGVKVNMTFAGRDVLNQTRSRLLVGDAPDLIDQDQSELTGALLGDEALVQPLTDLFYKEAGPEGQSKMMEIFNEALVKFYEKDGELYFLPYSFITSGFYYNKTQFEEIGVEAPETWEEFIKVNEKIKNAGIAPIAADGGVNFYNAYYYYWAVQRVLGSGALLKAALDETGKTWDDPGYLKAANMVYEISKGDRTHFQDGYDGSAWPSAQGEWATKGIAGSLLCGTWIPNETSGYAGDGFKYGYYPFPVVDGGKGNVTDVELYLIGSGILKDAKNPEAAKAFLKFILRKENAYQFALSTISISARKDSAYPSLLKAVKSTVDNAETFHLVYDGITAKAPEWTNNVFYPNDDALLFGNITPEDFIEKIKKGTIEFYSK